MRIVIRLPVKVVWEQEKLPVFGLSRRILQSKSGIFGEKFNEDRRKRGGFTASNHFRRKSNTGLAKVAVQCSTDTFVVNQSLVLRINIYG